ncbi:hypothetical protein EDC96DRAFT_575566 [Choanephora cucurbitarum]|nr:hypothetical protein EDC96DRAFT_575566 [Choanephora cucurbitarum]
MPAEVRFCSCCVQQTTFSKSRYKTCDDCRERTRNIDRMRSTTRLKNEADDVRRRGRKKQLPAAYISQLHRMKLLYHLPTKTMRELLLGVVEIPQM